MVRVDEETGLGVAIATDCNGRFAKLDPYAGAQLALAEAYRNVATAGAVPLAVTDCLNFGSPEDPDVMWQFARGHPRASPTAARELGIPVTGGNVSFYNQTGDVAIHPTPVVGVLGVIDDVARRTPSGWKADGQVDLPARARPRDELGRRRSGPTSCTATSAACRRRSTSTAERLLGEILVNASRDGLVDAAHDLSDGGLAQALAESSLRHGVGARIWLDRTVLERDGVDAFTALFSEIQRPRASSSVPRSEEVRFTDMCTARGFAHARIGVVDEVGEALDVQGQFTSAAGRPARRAHGHPPGRLRSLTHPDRTHRAARIRTLRVRIRALRCVRSRVVGVTARGSAQAPALQRGWRW